MNPNRRPTVFAKAVLSTALLGAGSAGATCKLQQLEIPVHIVDQRPIATVTLNGTEVRLLVDSGAFFSMLSASTAAQLQLPLRNLPFGMRLEGYTGRIEARMTKVEKMGLVGAQLSNMEFIVGGNEIGAGVMGVLGRNILSMADTEYDLAHGAVRLTLPKGDCGKTMLAHWAGEAPVIEAELSSKHDKDTAVRLDVRINGKRTSALLDTGAPQSSLTLRAARRAGIEEGTMTPYGRTGGAGAGHAKSWIGPVKTFELGGEKASNIRLTINDTEHFDDGMLLGLDYFLSHRIYVSRLQDKLYATWNGGPIFAQGREVNPKFDASHAAAPQAIGQDDADALARRGAAAIAAGNPQRALEDLNRACELAPGVATYFFARARLHQSQGRHGAALADFNEALRLDATLAEARMRRVPTRLVLGDRPGALADLAQLDTSLPPASGLRADMAETHMRLGQATEALKQFGLWIDTHPKDARLPSMLNGRCWLRTTRNLELDLALQDCKQAIDIDDQTAAFHDSLGWTYLRLKEFSRARKAFDGALALQPMAIALYGRGLALLRLNDLAGSERDLAAARQLETSIDDKVRRYGLETAETPAGKPAEKPAATPAATPIPAGS